MSAVIGVDLGSSAARAMALGRDGTVLGSVAAAYAGAQSWPPGRADPGGWLAAVTDAVTQLLWQLPAGPPACLSIGGQSPSTVPVRGANAVTCRHPVGATGSTSDRHVAQRRMVWEEVGDGSPVLQAYDWVAAALGSEATQSRWPGDPELAGFGPVTHTGELIGTTDGSHGLPPDVHVAAGAQDAYLAFWAGGIDTPGRGMDPGGRTGGLAVAVDAQDRQSDVYALRSATGGVDIVGGPVTSHGLMLEWLRDLTGCDVPSLLELAAAVPPGADGVLALPYLEGERAPRWNRDLRGEIVGLTAGAGRGVIARAVLEGTAYGLAHVAAQLRGMGAAPEVVVCAGSPARSRLWCAIKAAVLEVPVEVPVESDLAAYGAALAAGAGAGWWPRPGDGTPGQWPSPAVTVIEPEPRPEYREGYLRFVSLGDEAVRRLQAAHDKELTCPTR